MYPKLVLVSPLKLQLSFAENCIKNGCVNQKLWSLKHTPMRKNSWLSIALTSIVHILQGFSPVFIYICPLDFHLTLFSMDGNILVITLWWLLFEFYTGYTPIIIKNLWICLSSLTIIYHWSRRVTSILKRQKNCLWPYIFTHFERTSMCAQYFPCHTHDLWEHGPILRKLRAGTVHWYFRAFKEAHWEWRK